MAYIFLPDSKYAFIEYDGLYRLTITQGPVGVARVISFVETGIIYGGFLIALLLFSDDTNWYNLGFLLSATVVAALFLFTGRSLHWHFESHARHLRIATSIFGRRHRSATFAVRQISRVTYSRRDGEDGTTYKIQPLFLGTEPATHYKKRYDLTVGDEPTAQQICDRINAWLDSHRPPA